MKKTFSMLCIMPGISALIIILSCTSKQTGMPRAAQHNNAKKGAAVIELFTSQGCSSCPAAERLLGKYADKENVIVLSFHVDYWNRLGWKDPFSKAAFSERQQSYARLFGLNGVYTPQAVVNGEKEAVGSDENKISSYIAKAQSNESAVQIRIDEIKTDDKKATINFMLQGQVNNAAVNIALVQNIATTSIKAGENNGMKLTGYNVVRNFGIVKSLTTGKNTVSIDMVPGVDKKELSIVLFVQNNNETKISAAAKSTL